MVCVHTHRSSPGIFSISLFFCCSFSLLHSSLSSSSDSRVFRLLRTVRVSSLCKCVQVTSRPRSCSQEPSIKCSPDSRLNTVHRLLFHAGWSAFSRSSFYDVFRYLFTSNDDCQNWMVSGDLREHRYITQTRIRCTLHLFFGVRHRRWICFGVTHLARARWMMSPDISSNKPFHLFVTFDLLAW